MSENNTNNNFITPDFRDEYSVIEINDAVTSDVSQRHNGKIIMVSTPNAKRETFLSKFNTVNFIDSNKY